MTLKKQDELIKFDTGERTIEIVNNSEDSVDIGVFGGEKFTDLIVTQGPFLDEQLT